MYVEDFAIFSPMKKPNIQLYSLNTVISLILSVKRTCIVGHSFCNHRQYRVVIARSITRIWVLRFHRCFTFKTTNKHPLMGDLPRAELLPSDSSAEDKKHGVENAFKTSRPTFLFVCYTTKAVHRGLVINMTSDAFSSAYSYLHQSIRDS